MSVRELVVLGTAAQAPTRRRNHNGYLLRWDDEGILFDPGEGTQRQLLVAGVPVSAVTRICITHFHGDHCLGLAGVLQRRSLDQVARPVDVYFPASGAAFFDRLRYASVYHETAEVRPHPVTKDGVVAAAAAFRLLARRLDHSIETFGWRLEEPAGRRMLPERLAARGVAGPDVGRLLRAGSIELHGQRVGLAEVSAPRPGAAFAFVMDTRGCPGALELARGVDMLVCESTFLRRDAQLAEDYGHLTAGQAASLASAAGAKRLVLTHLSQRYQDDGEHLAEAAAVFPGALVARDFDRIPVPRDRRPRSAGAASTSQHPPG